ncbi:MAG: ribosome maturation factor RimP [Gammaproteobacteria bacterium]|nr:ribosome maturation factor RimP [Gammaproteobacteria bacterium]
MFAPVVESMGFELVGVDFSSSEHHGHLRVYIDHPDGITLENCTDVSRQLSALLDVEDPIQVAFDLEVSSPGLNRPLFKISDFEKYIGHMVKTKLAIPLNNRRNFKGTIIAVEGDSIELDIDHERFKLPFNSIAKANLVHQF